MYQAIESILFRKITAAELLNIDKAAGVTAGGGGQTYIDLPMGADGLSEIAEFIGAPMDGMFGSRTITAKAIGTLAEGDLDISVRGGAEGPRSYTIRRQNLTQARHPAWLPAAGFPTAPIGALSAAHPGMDLAVANLRIYIAKTTDGDFYCGFINTAVKPDNWHDGLTQMFDGQPAGILHFSSPPSHLASRILTALKRSPNVLLFGPPGTGKTHAMQEVWKHIEHGFPFTVNIDPTNLGEPFTVPKLPDMPTPCTKEWVTFHQNYGYEDFILGFRPVTNGAGFDLRPKSGALLDLLISVQKGIDDGSYSPKSAVLFIDEINRGNVSRIFGELITFLDLDYRFGTKTIPIPVPFPSLGRKDGKYEPVLCLSGDTYELPWPFYFPKHFYMICSMNSVDRAVAPLDSALARRFIRIEVRPDMSEFANKLKVDTEQAIVKSELPAPAADPDTPFHEDLLNARECAWLIFRRINYFLAATLGVDFEIGPAYLYGISSLAGEEDQFKYLAEVWDEKIYPLLQERFSSRPSDLEAIIPNVLIDGVLIELRSNPMNMELDQSPPPTLPSLSENFDSNRIGVLSTLRFLARG